MYLERCLVENSGAIPKLEIKFEFGQDASPKPLLLVGPNGAGKTNVLSIITDAIVELASIAFSDVMPIHADGTRQYYRTLGALNIKVGSKYELASLNFVDDSKKFSFISKVGELDFKEYMTSLSGYAIQRPWPTIGSHKAVEANADDIRTVFREGCYASFPAGRAELPYWSNIEPDDENSAFVVRTQTRLGKPITILKSGQDLKHWLVDVIMDQSIDVHLLLNLIKSNNNIRETILDLVGNTKTLTNFNTILRSILDVSDARITRAGRFLNQRKFQIHKGDDLLLPSLDSLSSGQSTLLSIFGTILRYADGAERNLSEMRGIVVVDEIDAHLHSDLQYTTLPRLIGLFPGVQFIVSAHSPLFPLGMEKLFGENGFQMIELPAGTKITAERFDEFRNSLDLLRRTKAFEDTIAQKVSDAHKPLLLCEGKTDAEYIRAAAEILGFYRLANGAAIEWIGSFENGESKGGGEGKLRQAGKILRNNPVLLKNHTLLLFDCDVSDSNSDDGLLHIRVIEQNKDNGLTDRGIENLLPESVFLDRFYSSSERQVGPDIISKRSLRKNELCQYLCVHNRVVSNFEQFRDTLQMIENTLFPDGDTELNAPDL